MEVVVPSSPIMDFDFNSARTSPLSSPPSTPGRFGDCFFSAPTSPTRLSEFYRELDRFSVLNDDRRRSSDLLAIPFGWEEKPGTPKSPRGAAVTVEKGDLDLAFDFREDLERTSLSAEELFDGGKIKPLKPPPRLQVDEYDLKSPLLSSPRSPRSPFSQGKKIIREAFSPRKKNDPFASAIESSRNCNAEQGRRGRERAQDLLSKNSSRRATRSLSPYRVSEYPWEEEEEEERQQHETATATSSGQSALNSKPSLSSTSSKGSSSRKWKLRDFLLFRSASEGRATDKDPFRKYSSGHFKKPEENKNSSFRSTDGTTSSTPGSARRKVSAHELHYTTNKAASENMKKKTFLPYKQGILGRLAFNPAVHALANGFGTLTRS